MKKPAAAEEEEYEGYKSWGKHKGSGFGGRNRTKLDEALLAPGIKTDYYARLTESKAHGGKRARVCNPVTAGMHWDSVLQFLGYLEREKGEVRESSKERGSFLFPQISPKRPLGFKGLKVSQT